MIQLFVIAKIAEGRLDEFLAEFHKVVPKVLAEDGCIEYGPMMDAETDITRQTRLGPQIVMIVEKWESTAALKAHLAAPHMADYKVATKGMVDDMTLHILEPV